MIVDFLEIDDDYVFVDVRTPKEYKEGSIGKCYNIPIFSNEEREIVGTVYKNESRQKAKILAVEAVSKKLPDIYKSFLEIFKEHKKVAIYCARGGMRSQTLGNLLSSLGHHVIIVKDGYKGYRNAVISETERLCNNLKFVVFHGNTGVSKTEIINGLSKKGIDTIDLEGLSKHRGSILGKIGIYEEVSQKNFEHDVYMALKNAKSGYIIVEAESRRIGKNFLSDPFVKAMKEGDHIFIDADIDYRVDFIINEYIKDEKHIDEIIEVLRNFKKGLGLEKSEELIRLMKEGKYKDVTKYLMLEYYDPRYMHKSNTYEYKAKFFVESIDKTVNEIFNFLKNNDDYVKLAKK